MSIVCVWHAVVVDCFVRKKVQSVSKSLLMICILLPSSKCIGIPYRIMHLVLKWDEFWDTIMLDVSTPVANLNQQFSTFRSIWLSFNVIESGPRVSSATTSSQDLSWKACRGRRSMSTSLFWAHSRKYLEVIYIPFVISCQKYFLRIVSYIRLSSVCTAKCG